jgi:hypothetical protein
MLRAVGFASPKAQETAQASRRRRLNFRRHDRAPAIAAFSTPPIIQAGRAMASRSESPDAVAD